MWTQTILVSLLYQRFITIWRRKTVRSLTRCTFQPPFEILNASLVQKNNEVEKVGIEAFHLRGFGKSRPLQTDALRRSKAPRHLGMLADFEEAA